LEGSWTLPATNANPTGITLDPSNVNHLWIVDSGTDRVYQYDAATSRLTGTQAASLSFGLAAGNTNPEGIADPLPVPVAAPRQAMLEEVFAQLAIEGHSEHRNVQTFKPQREAEIRQSNRLQMLHDQELISQPGLKQTGIDLDDVSAKEFDFVDTWDEALLAGLSDGDYQTIRNAF
jgi:hypothetical protein